MDYVKEFSQFNGKESVHSTQFEMKEYEDANKIDGFEVACLNNLSIETVEEAMTLVPSLVKFEDNKEELEDILQKLMRHRNT